MTYTANSAATPASANSYLSSIEERLERLERHLGISNAPPVLAGPDLGYGDRAFLPPGSILSDVVHIGAPPVVREVNACAVAEGDELPDPDRPGDRRGDDHRPLRMRPRR